MTQEDITLSVMIGAGSFGRVYSGRVPGNSCTWRAVFMTAEHNPESLLAKAKFAVAKNPHFFLGYQGGRTPTGWPHTAIRQARLPGARGRASPARYA
jgi:hypothetical protein